MTWNYRVVVFWYDPKTREELETPWNAIHEVYYDKDGDVYACSSEAARVSWDADDVDDSPYRMLERFGKALERPALGAHLFGF